MYRDHAPLIARAMQDDVATFERGCILAVLSARQPFITMPVMLADWELNADQSKYAFSWKRQAMQELHSRRDELRDAIFKLKTSDALRLVCSVHGLGLVKGAFVLQLAGHDIGCYDLWNLMREGLPLNHWSADKRRKQFERKLPQYMHHAYGKAQVLWDVWCKDMGAEYNRDPDTISKLHLTCIVK